MKFTCDCQSIKQEIEYAINFTSQRNSLSITSNVLLETANDLLTVKSTDNKMGFVSSIGVSTSVPGSITVFCDKLLAVLKNMPEGDIEISTEEDKLSIRPINSEKSIINVNIKTIPADKFPAMMDISDSSYFTLAQRDFFDMIDKTSFAVSDEETRHFLTGVYIEKKDGKLVTVATDGRKLACVRRSFEQEIMDFPPAIVSVKFLSLLKSIGKGDGVFSLAINSSSIFAKIDNKIIYSNLISGTYPNYERVIPSQLKYECRMSKSDMEKAISLISVLVEAKSKRIFIDLNKEGVLISGENTDFGDSKQIIKCEYDGPEARISFNYNLILTPIRKIDSDFIKIAYNTPQAAMVLLPEPEKDYLYVLMPMQV